MDILLRVLPLWRMLRRSTTHDEDHMNTLMTSVLLAGCVFMAGCASRSTDDATAQVMAESKDQVAQQKAQPSTMVGSRIPRKSTDRSIRQIGAQDYRDDNQIKSMANEIARPGQ